MTHKYSPFCDDPKKYPQNLHTPKNIYFSDPPPPPQNKEIQNFESKNDLSLRMYENIRIPPPPPRGAKITRIPNFSM